MKGVLQIYSYFTFSHAFHNFNNICALQIKYFRNEKGHHILKRI